MSLFRTKTGLVAWLLFVAALGVLNGLLFVASWYWAPFTFAASIVMVCLSVLLLSERSMSPRPVRRNHDDLA